MIVVDASVLVGFLLDQEAAVSLVIEALERDASGILHAPELIEPESLNALRGLERGGQITAAVAAGAISDLAEVRLIRHPHEPLRARVWELRHNLSSYDATYLALAEQLDDSVLLTGDGGLAEVAGHAPGVTNVRLVQE